MPVKNLMEDIVTSMVNEIMQREEDELSGLTSFREDVVAYVLNRIQPKYYTSERGILHGKLDEKFIFQIKADVLLMVYESIKIIRSRRESSDCNDDNENLYKKSLFFPHIMGEVLEVTTMSVIPDLEIHLTLNGKPAKMIDSTWKNPYITHKAIKGYFHFWPDFDEKKMKNADEASFKIVFKHENFKPKEVDLIIPVLKEFSIQKTHILPLEQLELKDGIDVSFLYD